MIKFSIFLIAVLFTMALNSAMAVTWTIARPCERPWIRKCTTDRQPYCVKLNDGSIHQQYGSGSCPPCDGKVRAYYRGICPGTKTSFRV